MKFQGAVIREQGVTFAIVIVKRYILNNITEANKTANSYQSIFPGLTIILMGQDPNGVPNYFGRKDIVNFLSEIPLSSIPWKEYTYG
jgi:hypothetical protein